MAIDNATAVKNFIRFFKDHPPSFAKNLQSTAMIVGGRKYQYDDLNSIDRLFNTKAVLDYELTDWWRADAEEKLGAFTSFVTGTYRREALEAQRHKEELKDKIRANGKTDLVLPNTDYIIYHLQPYRYIGDVRKEAGYKFWDTKLNIPTLYDYHSIHGALRSSKIDKEIIEDFMTKALHAVETYEPHKNYGLTKQETEANVYWINQYVSPAWRSLQVEPELPKEIEALMAHLFPEEECREFTYTWIYHSLTSRCGTYLYLNGGQGSGKNTLAKVLAKLHGDTNTSFPKQDAINGRFNLYLKHKRFVFFDEFHCRTRQDKDTLKRIINSRIQVEAKHKDTEDIDIHASYYIANNLIDAISLEPKDRRFSVPNITHKDHAPESDLILRILRAIEDPTYIAKFGYWILENFKSHKWDSETPYQKERYEEIVLATARFGIAEVLAKIWKREQNEYEYYEERDSFKRAHKGQSYPSILDWEKFFRDVKKGGKPLGEVVDHKFIPREEFRVEGC